MTKLSSSVIVEQEEAVISLRKLTRTKEELRVSLCTPRLLSALRSLIVSRYSTVQVNAVASLVDVLKSGSGESQEHAAGALFSLALEEDNKMAIGVLGALPISLSPSSDLNYTAFDSKLSPAAKLKSPRPPPSNPLKRKLEMLPENSVHGASDSGVQNGWQSGSKSSLIVKKETLVCCKFGVRCQNANCYTFLRREQRYNATKQTHLFVTKCGLLRAFEVILGPKTAFYYFSAF